MSLIINISDFEKVVNLYYNYIFPYYHKGCKYLNITFTDKYIELKCKCHHLTKTIEKLFFDKYECSKDGSMTIIYENFRDTIISSILFVEFNEVEISFHGGSLVEIKVVGYNHSSNKNVSIVNIPVFETNYYKHHKHMANYKSTPITKKKVPPSKLKVDTNTNIINLPTGQDIVANDDTKDNDMCQICMINEVRTINLPCGHIFFCIKCANDNVTEHKKNTCPMCNTKLVEIKQFYK